MAENSVTGDKYQEYYEVDGQLLEITKQLRLKDGYPYSVDALRVHLQKAIEGEFAKPLFKRDLRKERGYKLIEEGPQHPQGVTVADLKLKEFLNYDEEYIEGKEFQKRAVKLEASLGQHTVEYVLEHQDDIPKGWRDFYLIFPGTIWQSSFGDRYVPCLYWFGGQWCLCFNWLDSRFHSNDCLVGVRK